jgi:hypothetical protein
VDQFGEQAIATARHKDPIKPCEALSVKKPGQALAVAETFQ